jgi:hypothetical protein
VLKDHDETVLYALLAYLNSAICRESYQSFTGETRKTFPQVHIASVKRLRVPDRLLDASCDQTRRLAAIAKQLSAGKSGGQSSQRFTAAIEALNALVGQLTASRRSRRSRRVRTSQTA